MIYRFRIVLDVLEDIFRDIEMRENATLEDLHNAIVQAFGLEGEEMASFYLSDEKWGQGEEFVLFDMGERTAKKMDDTALNNILSEKQTRLIYVYDFLNMWTFYVELAEITEPINGMDYPNLLFSHGNLPDSPPEKNFEAEPGYDDDFDGPGFENMDDFDEFDERWN